ncbi:MAG: ribosome rescue GTPase HflX [Pseudomonadota bacterium]|nr:ribosome rescue GTPase HflX [Pseudomonadota bacterium]
MFERHRRGEDAVLVHIEFSEGPESGDPREFFDLVESAGVTRVALITGSRKAPDPGRFVGAGKAAEIRDAALSSNADVIIFDHSLTPSQVRGLELFCKRRVIDRTELILDIFAQRARSHEGKLQVELAQLSYLSTRLVRGWTHLERQKGGIGLRGPGEKQLESDRRLIGQRIKQIRKRLDRVRTRRDQGRQARGKADVPTVALVGYTNAGKSTLFNRATGSDVYAADKLFATLDPTLRRYDLKWGATAVLADTVGFIRRLPHDLVESFHATLRETREADLLLHVVDVSDDRAGACIAQVDAVLEEIGAADVPRIVVLNKIDSAGLQPRVQRDEQGNVTRIWLSAHTGDGIGLLHEALSDRFMGETVHGLIRLRPGAARLRARLFELGAVVSERAGDDGGWELEIALPRARYEEMSRLEDLPGELLPV